MIKIKTEIEGTKEYFNYDASILYSMISDMDLVI